MTPLIRDDGPRLASQVAQLGRELAEPALFPTLAVLGVIGLGRLVAATALASPSEPSGARAAVVLVHLELAAAEFSDATGFDTEVLHDDSGGRVDSATQIAVRGLLGDCVVRVDDYLDNSCDPDDRLMGLNRAMLHLDSALRRWPAGQPLAQTR